jgi:hypothetical protein
LPALLKPLFIKIRPFDVIVPPFVIVVEFKLSKAVYVAVLIGLFRSFVLSTLSRPNDDLVTAI